MTARYCRACDYSLDNAREHRCPECGRGFDPERPRTFAARPNARRRRLVRRGVVVLCVLLLLWALLPREVARVTLSWPSADHSTLVTRTYWCPIAPSWLPFRYPRLAGAEVSSPMPAGVINTLSLDSWRLRAFHYAADGGWSFSIPQQPGFVGYISVQRVDPQGEDAGPATVVPILPGRLDEVLELALERQGPRRVMAGNAKRELLEQLPAAK